MKLDSPTICALFVLFQSTGCETSGLARTTAAQCLHEEPGPSRDECYFQLIADAAENQDLETCMQEMFHIEDPLLRSAAVRMVISRQPQGMDRITAQNLCRQLHDAESADCLRSWDRAHLWSLR